MTKQPKTRAGGEDSNRRALSNPAGRKRRSSRNHADRWSETCDYFNDTTRIRDNDDVSRRLVSRVCVRPGVSAGESSLPPEPRTFNITRIVHNRRVLHVFSMITAIARRRIRHNIYTYIIS